MAVVTSLKELARELGPQVSVHTVRVLRAQGAPIKPLRGRRRTGRRYIIDVEQVLQWIHDFNARQK